MATVAILGCSVCAFTQSHAHYFNTVSTTPSVLHLAVPSSCLTSTYGHLNYSLCPTMGLLEEVASLVFPLLYFPRSLQAPCFLSTRGDLPFLKQGGKSVAERNSVEDVSAVSAKACSGILSLEQPPKRTRA